MAHGDRNDDLPLQPEGAPDRVPDAQAAYPDRAAAEAAPREIETGGGGADGIGMGAQRAVDENRPADIVNQAGIADTTDFSAPRMSPNVLQRQHVIAPQDRVRRETPGEELAEDEQEALSTQRGDVTI